MTGKAVEGRVLDVSGAPVAGVYVRIFNGRVSLEELIGHRGLQSPGDQYGMARTDATGRFSFTQVPAGPYHLVAEVPRQEPPARVRS